MTGSSTDQVAALILSKLPGPTKMIAAPHLNKVFSEDGIKSICDMLCAMAQNEEMSLLEFVESGKLTEIALQVCGVSHEHTDECSIKMDMCPKCNHITYLE